MGGLPTRTVYGFAVAPGNPRMMYVAMREGLFKSTDAGATWTRVDAAPTNLAAVAVSPTVAGEAYLATADGVIVKSTNGGTTWQRP